MTNKKKLLAPFMMLFAGAVSSITMYIFHYDMKSMLLIILVVLIVFYVTGVLMTKMIARFQQENEKNIAAEEEVIEKEPPVGEAESDKKEESELKQ